MYRISYRFLVPGWSAKRLASAHDRIMGTDRVAFRVATNAQPACPERSARVSVLFPE